MADGVDTSVVDALNKLRKSELVEIIITKKVPMSCTSDLLSDFVNKLYNSEEFHDTTDVLSLEGKIGCDKTPCLEYKLKCEYTEKAIDYQKVLICHLEKRIVDLEHIISLIKDKQNTNKNSDDTVKSVQTTTSVSAVLKQPSHKNGTTENNNMYADIVKKMPAKTTSDKMVNLQTQTRSQEYEKTINKDMKISEKNSSYRQQTSKQNKQTKQIIGTSNISVSTIKTVPKMGYVYVSRLDRDTTTVELENHLKHTAPDVRFIIELIRKTNISSSFKISFPLDFVQLIYDPSIWPEGAGVKRYFFPRTKTLPQQT